MSGLDLLIYIAGILLLSKLFLKELIVVARLAQRFVSTVKTPVQVSLPAQSEAVVNSKDASTAPYRKNVE